jgi:dephospho-CoA kinase
MLLIGITGTMGAGKGTIVSILVERYAFVHYSARAFLIKEIERRVLPVNRDSMIEVSNDLRTKHGADYMIRTLHAQAKEDGCNAIIESVLTTGEAQYLKEQGALLIAIDADRRVRYERITSRQSETDRVSFEKFMEQEERKMHSDDPSKHNVAGVMALADIHLMNNGTIESLESELRRLLAERGII